MTDYIGLIERLENFGYGTTNPEVTKRAAEAIKALIEERDAALAEVDRQKNCIHGLTDQCAALVVEKNSLLMDHGGALCDHPIIPIVRQSQRMVHAQPVGTAQGTIVSSLANLLCFFGLHDWEYTFATHMDSVSERLAIPTTEGTRTCTRCGLKQTEDRHCLGFNPPEYTTRWYNS